MEFNLYCISSLKIIQQRFFKSTAFLVDGVYPTGGIPQEFFYTHFNLQVLPVVKSSLYQMLNKNNINFCSVRDVKKHFQ